MVKVSARTYVWLYGVQVAENKVMVGQMSNRQTGVTVAQVFSRFQCPRKSVLSPSVSSTIFVCSVGCSVWNLGASFPS